MNDTGSHITGNSTYVCQYPGEILAVNSKGLFMGDNPLYFSTPLLMLQLSIIALTTFATNCCLKPFGQSSVVSQILAGIILGPSLIGHNKTFMATIFPKGSHSTLETLATFSVMFFMFQTGVKTDPGLIRQCGRKSVVIGVLVYAFPLAFATSYALLLQHFVVMDESLAKSLPMIAGSQALTGFIVIACHLTEMKLINTDLGRLAISSSMVGDLLGISSVACFMSAQRAKTDPLDGVMGIVTTILMVILIVYVIRPVTLWIVKPNSTADPVKEVHIFSLFVTILLVGFLSEVVGQHFVLGPLLLGLALPDGPPLGAELVERLESFVTFILFPTYLTVSGLKTDVFTIQPKSSWIVATIVLFACLVKVAAAMLPCLYCHMPWRDAFVLGLTMNTKGIVELLLYNIWRDSKILKEQEFSLTVISVLLLTAIISPMVKCLYDPSKRFVSSKKNTIQHAKPNAELRILVCIHKSENVPSIINVLEITHPTAETPISVFVLQLVELKGRAAPVLVAHQQKHNLKCGSSRTQTVVNAFKQYELQNNGVSSIQPYTAIAHLSTMHDDICNLALDKQVNFVITPFHKEWAIDGEVGSENRSIRTMNCNILDKAPCSVGILVDRNILSNSLSILTSRSFYRVCVLFMGGADDGESLAYGARMAQHPQVRLTVIRFLAFGCDNARDRKLDSDTIEEFRAKSAQNRQIEYKEEVVRDGEGLATSIKDIGSSYDLVMVGRHHKHENKLLSGLNEWNECECPELGIVGDMLASSDFKGLCSVLVVQQAKVRPTKLKHLPKEDVNPNTPKLVNTNTPNADNGAQDDGTWRISVER